jgi:aminoglycoside 2''-phosphotransferase
VPLLNKAISLSIPNLKYIPEDKSFVGYRYIKGVPLSNKIIKGLSDKQREACAKQIAKFINELHHFSVPIAAKNGVDVLYGQYDLKTKRSVIHRDLIDEHIVFNQQKNKIVGIIDFGDVAIADPALEFSRIWRYGEKFLDLILKYYKTTDMDIKESSKMLWLSSKQVS